MREGTQMFGDGRTNGHPQLFIQVGGKSWMSNFIYGPLIFPLNNPLQVRKKASQNLLFSLTELSGSQTGDHYSLPSAVIKYEKWMFWNAGLF